MHYYKRNLGDYAKKAGRLSMLQHGSYTLLMDACYDREQFPTLAEAIDWTWASSTAEVEAVQFVLNKFFVLEGDKYVQKRVQEEVAEYHAKSETNTRIALEREAKRKAGKTTRARTVNKTSSEKHEAPPNQEPLTNNQEPEGIQGAAPPSPQPAGKKPKSKPSASLVTIDDLVSEGVDRKHADDWMLVRKAKSLPLTRTAWDAILAEAGVAGLSAGEVVRQAAENGWGGFRASWGQNQNAGPRGSAPPINRQEALEQRNAAVGEAWARGEI